MTQADRLNWNAFLLKCWVDACFTGEWEQDKAYRWFFMGSWRN